MRTGMKKTSTMKSIDDTRNYMPGKEYMNHKKGTTYWVPQNAGSPLMTTETNLDKRRKS